MRVIHTDLDGLVRIDQLEEELESLGEDHAALIEDYSEARDRVDRLAEDYSEVRDRADRLAVVADALASELSQRYDEMDALWWVAVCTEGKLGELAEAAEWRDECQGAKDHCLWRREDYFAGDDRWDRWDHSFIMAIDYLDRAEADYQAALKAAKGE